MVGNLTADNISLPKIKLGDDLSSGEENSLKAEVSKASNLKNKKTIKKNSSKRALQNTIASGVSEETSSLLISSHRTTSTLKTNDDLAQIAEEETKV